MRLHTALADPRRYRRQIERLHAKHLTTRRLYELRQSEVSLASFFLNRSTVARLLARTVERGEYRLAPAKIRTPSPRNRVTRKQAERSRRVPGRPG